MLRMGGPKIRRGGVIALGAFLVVIASYAISHALHRLATQQVEAARGHMARGEWLEAIGCLDTARREDYLPVDAYLLRATAINESILAGLRANTWSRPAYSRQDALADLDWYLRHRPNSGEAHYQRGLALAGLAKVEAAREELAGAIALLDDPTDALVERAALSLHVSDYETAVKEITGAIERRPLVPEYYETRALYRRFLPDLRGARADELKAQRLRASKDVSVEELEVLAKAEGDDRPIAEPQDAPAVSAERARFLGRWNVVARQAGGESIDTTGRDFTITFRPDGYRLVLDGEVQQDASYWLDPTRRPRRIDWKATIRGKEHRMLGLYEFRGDTLHICMANLGEARPATLTAAELDPSVLYTLRRPAGHEPPGPR
jgi:uncharacterized protein (TIGR03067 family)